MLRRQSIVLFVAVLLAAGCAAPGAGTAPAAPAGAAASSAGGATATAMPADSATSAPMATPDLSLGTPAAAGVTTPSAGGLAGATTETSATTPAAGAATPAITAGASTPAPTADTSSAAATPAGGAVTATQATTGTGPIQLTLASSGNEVRYRVREQLAGRSFPNDAIGRTSAISGAVVIQPDGSIVPDQSKFVIDLRTLKSDEGRRDRFIQGNTLQTSTYPNAEFVIKSVEGLPSPLPKSGAVAFKLNGDMTIHGATKPASWDVKGTVNGSDLTGTATTSFVFEDYGMTPPRAAVVLSVEDHVTLEMDFHLTASGGTSVEAPASPAGS